MITLLNTIDIIVKYDWKHVFISLSHPASCNLLRKNIIISEKLCNCVNCMLVMNVFWKSLVCYFLTDFSPFIPICACLCMSLHVFAFFCMSLHVFGVSLHVLNVVACLYILLACLCMFSMSLHVFVSLCMSLHVFVSLSMSFQGFSCKSVCFFSCIHNYSLWRYSLWKVFCCIIT